MLRQHHLGGKSSSSKAACRSMKQAPMHDWRARVCQPIRPASRPRGGGFAASYPPRRASYQCGKGPRTATSPPSTSCQNCPNHRRAPPPRPCRAAARPLPLQRPSSPNHRSPSAATAPESARTAYARFTTPSRNDAANAPTHSAARGPPATRSWRAPPTSGSARSRPAPSRPPPSSLSRTHPRPARQESPSSTASPTSAGLPACSSAHRPPYPRSQRTLSSLTHHPVTGEPRSSMRRGAID